jgi:hypothetical protein
VASRETAEGQVAVAPAIIGWPSQVAPRDVGPSSSGNKVARYGAAACSFSEHSIFLWRERRAFQLGHGVSAVAVFREQASRLALTEATPRPWHQMAALIEDAGSTAALLDGSVAPYGASENELLSILVSRTTPEMIDRWEDRIRTVMASSPPTSLLTVLDADYPDNLKRIYNRPPFRFVRGTRTEADSRWIAVVGTRRASAEGRRRASELAATLAHLGVIVVSGLASGIDTAAPSAVQCGG